MLVRCPNCRSKARINSTHKVTDAVTDLYCACSNTSECSATFVFTLAHKHYINPPMKTTKEIALSFLNELPPKELQEMLKQNALAKQS